jgi:hypothetical protein
MIRRCAVWPAEPNFFRKLTKLVDLRGHFPETDENLID